ncbi:uncharacterized protein bean1 isoform X3 [Phycodurus eques]|uniref:uncharacterized protein bean1 isoform X3 n=1 Tax=Phycodurus eques TaxID=693459 RepID=UPI002ACD9BA0|nr:uncharacterized protein bean1 isoform X3 [Phycodurus eques]
MLMKLICSDGQISHVNHYTTNVPRVFEFSIELEPEPWGVPGLQERARVWGRGVSPGVPAGGGGHRHRPGALPLLRHHHRGQPAQRQPAEEPSPESHLRYDECVGPGCTHIYIPTDDPPPYSLWDPRRDDSEEGPSSAGAASPPSEHQGIASISFPSEAAPPYEAVVADQGQPLPLVPCDLSKHRSERDVDGNRRPSGISQIS